MISSDLQHKLREKYNPDGSMLRLAQLRMTEMLSWLDGVCRKHGLSYWIDSGTLLGAVRHGGFIPWDDDVDVCMPTDDIIKLKRLMQSPEFTHEFIIQEHANDPGYYGPWVVIRDLKSEYVQDSIFHKIRKFKGLQIDIFPVRKDIGSVVHKIARILQNQLIDIPLRQGHLLGLKLKHGFLHNLVFPFLRGISRIGGTRRVMMTDLGCGYKLSMPHDNVWPLSEVDFEGIKLLAPAKPEKYLTGIYGNWHTVPSPDTIRTHNVQVKFL